MSFSTSDRFPPRVPSEETFLQPACMLGSGSQRSSNWKQSSVCSVALPCPFPSVLVFFCLPELRDVSQTLQDTRFNLDGSRELPDKKLLELMT